MYYIFFIRSSIDGHLGCFYVLAIVNSAAMKHWSACILLDHIFLHIYAQGHIVSLFLVFKGTSILFSIVVVPSGISTKSLGEFLLSTPSPAFIVCGFFDDSHFDWYKVTSHHIFDLHLSSSQQCWTSFHVPLGYLYIFFGEMSI